MKKKIGEVLDSRTIFMGFPVDLLMYALNKILPRRAIPKELREACDMSADEKVFG